jgi:toxin FitB
MYLLDTNVISETRKGPRANAGVLRFMQEVIANGQRTYIAAPSIGELRYGVERLRYRRDVVQALRIEAWLNALLQAGAGRVLSLDEPCAQTWGRLMVPDRTNQIDKQIAAIALVNHLTLVTRNVRDFQTQGLNVINPFTESN